MLTRTKRSYNLERDLKQESNQMVLQHPPANHKALFTYSMTEFLKEFGAVEVISRRSSGLEGKQ